MPNRELWSEIPGMARDGFNFVASGGQTQSHYTKYASVDDTTPLSSQNTKKKKSTKKPAGTKAATAQLDAEGATAGQGGYGATNELNGDFVE